LSRDRWAHAHQLDLPGRALVVYTEFEDNNQFFILFPCGWAQK
jgi:hypothetical protein